MMRLLLLSNSTLPGEPYLGWPRPYIHELLGARQRVAFVPFAAVSFSMDEYADMTQKAFGEMGHDLVSLHRASDPHAELAACDAVAVGGGNTFQLLRTLYTTGLIRGIADRAKRGMPYIGWSAGSNVACPTIMTTNDMPITEPPSLRAMHLVPFQINPHYTDVRPEGHAGESRDQRIAEFLVMNPKVKVAGLREGSLLHVVDRALQLSGRDMRVFEHGRPPKEVAEGTTLRSDLADA